MTKPSLSAALQPRLPLPRWGAVPVGDDIWRIATWAPSARRVEVVCAARTEGLAPCGDGYWKITTQACTGEPYALIIDGALVHDPASRQQARTLGGLSVLHDPSNFQWQTPWKGRPWQDLVICEIHIGTFTHEGTFAAAHARLSDLARVGITAIEVMPVAHGPGTRGWGYNGVLPFAPHPAYGTPDDFRAFVDHAHSLGMCVLLDVVFNHFGPQGAEYVATVPDFTADRDTSWGLPMKKLACATISPNAP